MENQDGKVVLKEDFSALKYLECRIPRVGQMGHGLHSVSRLTAIRVEGRGRDARMGAKVVTIAQGLRPGTLNCESLIT